MQPLAQRVLVDERRELGDQLGVAPEPEVRVAAVLDRRRPAAPRAGAPRAAATPSSASPSSAGPRQSASAVGEHARTRPPRRRRSSAARPSSTSAANRAGVDLLRRRPRAGSRCASVTSRSARVAERAPQLRHQRLQGVGDAGRELVAVEVVDQPVDADGLARVDQQQREQRPRLGAPGRRPPLAVGERQRPRAARTPLVRG